MTYTIIEDDLETKEFLSIAMLTYNHEKFISEAIESVLFQKTNFSYKIVIAEDFSTDKTRDIVISYQKKYPDKIRLLLQDKNVGANENNKILFNNLKGKYIAALEGDDYWTDPLKLQKQVDFLEENQEYGMVCSNYYLLEGADLQKNDFTSQNSKIDILLKDLLYKNPIGTLTVLFRANLLENFLLPSETMIGDMWIWMHIATKSKIKYFEEYTGAYRILQNSASHRNDLEKRFKFLYNAYEIVNHFSEKVILTNQERRNIYSHRLYPIFQNLAFRKKYFSYLKLYFEYIKKTRTFEIIPFKLFIYHLFVLRFKNV